MDRRIFIKNASIAVAGLNTVLNGSAMATSAKMQKGKKIGIIGLDTSHSVAFTKALNAPSPQKELLGYKIVAAYPYGSKTIESSASRIPGYIEDVKQQGVEIVDSIATLLEKVDVVMLETNDGRLHLEQALAVIKAKKPLFIDKPVAASWKDVKQIYDTAKRFSVPVFSASSLRYMDTVQAVRAGKVGKVLGADTYSPATLEPNHPDFFWYGIHGVEMLITVMGVGCEQVSRVHTDGTDVVVGIWNDGRIGTFRGTRTGKHTYGGTAYGENGDLTLGPYNGYDGLIKQIIGFFETGQSPVTDDETLAIYAFMVAADESKKLNGKAVFIRDVLST